MLCLKPEALDEDHHPQSPNSNTINGNRDCNGGNNGGFILPISWWVSFFFFGPFSFSVFFFWFCNGECSMVDGFAGEVLLIDIYSGKVVRFGASHFQLGMILVILVLNWR